VVARAGVLSNAAITAKGGASLRHRQETAIKRTQDSCDTDRTTARVLTFHIDPEERAGLMEALDSAEERLSQSPEFRGLLCLEDESQRLRITVVSLWREDAMDTTAHLGEAARCHIASTTDLGVTSRVEKVIKRF
jgi:hypothetical protein